MNSPVTEAEKSAADAEQAVAAATDAGAPSSAPQNSQSDAAQTSSQKRGGQRNGRSGRGGGAPRAARGPENQGGPAGADKAMSPRRQNPALLQLATLYPQLFGEQPKPLKRGIFQDLEQAQLLLQKYKQ